MASGGMNSCAIELVAGQSIAARRAADRRRLDITVTVPGRRRPDHIMNPTAANGPSRQFEEQ
jgi:hypothetical protein